MPHALLSGPCTMGKTLQQGQSHFLLRMWRSRHTAEALMGGKQGGDARMSSSCEKVEDL